MFRCSGSAKTLVAAGALFFRRWLMLTGSNDGLTCSDERKQQDVKPLQAAVCGKQTMKRLRVELLNLEVQH